MSQFRLLTEPKSPNIYAILLILLVALAARVWGLSYGLPAMNDADEPFFMLTALRMVGDQSANPEWFGHPGTITLYTLVLVVLMVFIGYRLTGAASDTKDFADQVFSDPTILVMSARTAIMLFGVLGVYLIYKIGLRLFGRSVGLLAAGLLAINPLHISFSQIVRTDVQVTVFMLASILFCIKHAQDGGLRNIILAAVMIGLGTATKWPAATFILCPLMAGWNQLSQERAHIIAYIRLFAIIISVTVASLIIASPYLLLDFGTAYGNLSGEMQADHLGATGSGFFDNLVWYGRLLQNQAFGIFGLALFAIGLIYALATDSKSRIIIIPAAVIFLVLLSMQSLRWDRWLVPLLPYYVLFMALAIAAVGKALHIWASKLGVQTKALPHMVQLMAIGAIAVPALTLIYGNVQEKTHDTRNLAAQWALENIPANKTIIIEHWGFDLLQGPWALLFPAGRMGCLDVTKQIESQIKYVEVEEWRGSSAIVDFGTVDTVNADNCRADFAIFTHHSRYVAEKSRYAVELARYENAIAGGKVMKVFTPKPGLTGGPKVLIVRLKK